jgi:hypothetical protein
MLAKASNNVSADLLNCPVLLVDSEHHIVNKKPASFLSEESRFRVGIISDPDQK